MQSTISSGLTQQVWGSQYWHSIKKSELNTSDYELTERNKAKIDECLKERQEAMDARASKEGYHAQIGELVADDFIRNIRPNAKLSHPKDLATQGSKPGDFNMVYLSDDTEEIIIVEAKGGSRPLGSRKIGNEAYQQGTSKYAAEIVKLMSEQKAGTTEIDASDGVSKVNVKEFDISLEELG